MTEDEIKNTQDEEAEITSDSFEEIISAKPDELLTPRERGLKSLLENKYKKGHKFTKAEIKKRSETQARKRAERKSKRIFADSVKKVLGNEHLVDLMLKNKPDWMQALEYELDEDGKMLIDPIDVMTAVQVAKALQGNTKAYEALRKSGWGDQLTIDLSASVFSSQGIDIEVVDTKRNDDAVEGEVVSDSSEM